MLAADPQSSGGVWLLAEVDVSKIDTTPERLNVSLPANLVEQIDSFARSQGATRSASWPKLREWR